MKSPPTLEKAVEVITSVMMNLPSTLFVWLVSLLILSMISSEQAENIREKDTTVKVFKEPIIVFIFISLTIRISH